MAFACLSLWQSTSSNRGIPARSHCLIPLEVGDAAPTHTSVTVIGAGAPAGKPAAAAPAPAAKKGALSKARGPPPDEEDDEEEEAAAPPPASKRESTLYAFHCVSDVLLNQL